MTFKIGDVARSIESGWLGMVIEIDIDSSTVDTPLIKLYGIDEWAVWINGKSIEQAVDSSDPRWFVEDDLKLVRRAAGKVL